MEYVPPDPFPGPLAHLGFGSPVPLRLGCFLFLLPFLEVAILFRVGQWIGFLPTLSLVLGTFALGLLVAKGGGVRAAAAVRSELLRGRLPARALLDGAMVLVGAVLLLAPGVLTDLAGLGLLVPPLRRLVHGWVEVRLARAVASGGVRIAVWGRGGSYGREPGVPGSPERPPGTTPRPEDQDRLPPRDGEIIQD